MKDSPAVVGELVDRWREDAKRMRREGRHKGADDAEFYAEELESTLSALTAEAGKGEEDLRGSGEVIGRPEMVPSDSRLAPHHCKGTNCTASKTNGYKHSSECLFEHAAAVASGIKSVAYGVTVPDSATYINWRGQRIELLALSTATPAGEWVLVPRELTNEMQIAGLTALDESDATPDAIGHLIGYKAVREAYRAMLAASPRGASESGHG